MSSYGYPTPDQGPLPPSAYARDRFWSSPPTSGGGGGAGAGDPWGASYTPQLEISSFSNSNYLSYPNGAAQNNSSSSSSPGSVQPGSQNDLTFSGPSPPNPTQLQPISYPPPPSPCRGGGYTPSSTPTPLITPKQANGGVNGGGSSSHNNHHSSSSASNSPPNNGLNTSRAFSYLDQENPTSMQNGGPPNGGPSGSSTLLSLGGNKNEMINGGGDEGMYRAGNGGSRYGDGGPLNIKSEPGSSEYQSYHQSYYQNYPTPTTTTTSGGGGGGYNQQNYYHQDNNSSSSSSSASYNPYNQQQHHTHSHHHQQQQQQQQMYPAYPPDHPHHHPHSHTHPHQQQQDYGGSNYGGGGGPPPNNSSSSSSSPPNNNERKPTPPKQPVIPGSQDPGKMYDYNYDPSSSSNHATSPPASSYRSYAANSSSPPNSSLVKMEARTSPNNNSTSPPSTTTTTPLIPPPVATTTTTKGKNGKDKKKNNNSVLPPPNSLQDKKEFGGENNKGTGKSDQVPLPPPLPAAAAAGAKKKRKKRTKPTAAEGKKGDSSNSEFGRGIKEEGKEGGGISGVGNKGKKGGGGGKQSQIQHLQQQRSVDEEDLLLDLEDGGGGPDYNDDDDSKGRSGGGGAGGGSDKDVPMVECGCFPADEVHAEPGPFYTHLGAAQNLIELRKVVESRTGFRGNQVRLEKVIYTGKEGKTGVGCPLAKWILRRGSFEEQLLFLVKQRKGHKCSTAWIVVCCVIWEGVPPHFSDNLYDTLVYKLNRFGIPTTRRSDTNEQRSCACQGVDPDTCGAAYSFGCAWSMFFNGCKYARSRNVRKFRLTEEHEESELEEKVQHLATHLAPLYERVAQDSYTNQIDHENEGLECRLGYRPGRPFSGVTACLDYCSHAHKDAHNMMNGCTVTVSLARHRTLSKPDDEQFHVLPLYKLDDTDEYGSKEGQKAKIKKGQLEILKKYPCKVRIRKVPLLPSRRRAKAKSPGGGGGSGGGGGGSKGGSESNSSTPTVTPTTPTSKIPQQSGGILGGGIGNALLGGIGGGGGDYGSEMPPAKREKLFDERLSNGGDAYGDRFHHQGGGYGLGQQLPGLGHSFNDLTGGGGAPSGTGSLWNTPHFGMGGSSSSPSNSSPHHRGLSSSYFDHASSSTSSSSLSGGGGGPLGPGGTSSSLSSLTELTNSTISRHGSTSSTGGGGSSSSSTLLSSPGSSGGNPGSASSSGYSSMSPILPSFRNTFMTEAESLGLGENNSASSSSSSPRSHQQQKQQGQQQSHHHQQQQLQSTPAFQDHTSSHPYGASASSSSSSPYNPGGSSSLHYASSTPLYHPQPHNPCLPPTSHLHHNSHHHNPYQPQAYHPHDAPSPYTASFPPSLGGWSAAAAAYSSNYAAAAAYSSYPGLQAPNYMSHHHQYSPYHHQHHIPPPPPSRMIPGQSSVGSSSAWGQSPHQFNFSAGGQPAPLGMNMNMNMNLVPPQGGPVPGPPPSCFVTPPKPKVIPEVNESSSDNEDCFKDPAMGGVAIALTHGSVILQCAKHEMHATTALKNPNRMYPSRICLIFYQHKSMNNRFHGWSEWEKKIEAKKLQEVKLINQGKMEASPRKMKQLIKEGYIQDQQ
ncbi:DNA N6-methyl adenine demethylase-like [Folsomia candida]|uniref:Methylcytosine dioxygenase TET n=1 Tax=Folsomia candida TaxID=158441 RepID=A0A226CYQ1_FOLCA|nr:DNA N6-methyl adenine demethylase-like [Folsomia candida]OXA37668.1 DNA N6-methyl adenine demethylase [Folsomia candida]